MSANTSFTDNKGKKVIGLYDSPGGFLGGLVINYYSFCRQIIASLFLTSSKDSRRRGLRLRAVMALSGVFVYHILYFLVAYSRRRPDTMSCRERVGVMNWTTTSDVFRLPPTVADSIHTARRDATRRFWSSRVGRCELVSRLLVERLGSNGSV